LYVPVPPYAGCRTHRVMYSCIGPGHRRWAAYVVKWGMQCGGSLALVAFLACALVGRLNLSAAVHECLGKWRAVVTPLAVGR
jgi:hypothetical protein